MERPVPTRILKLAVAVGLAGLVAVYLGLSLTLAQTNPLMAFFRAYVHSGLMVAAAVISIVVAVRARRERWAWVFVAIGLTAFAGGEVVWRFVYADMDAPPYPSWADALWLTTYPAFYIGLMLLVRSRVAALSPGAWLDGLIAGTSLAALGVTFYFAPVLERTHGDATAVAVTMAYPLGDLLLWVLLLAVLAISGGRMSRSFALMCVGQIAVTVGDSVLAMQTAAGTYVEGRWADVMWPLGALLIAASGVRPVSLQRVKRVVGWRAVVVPAVFVSLAGGLQVMHRALDYPLGVDVLISATFLLVLFRAGLALRENLDLLERSRQEAHRDALTGLRNRRALLLDLEEALADGGPHTLTLFDLNGFKAYNDAFGHLAGDALLHRLGHALERAVDGRAYRLGGDEFCVLSPLTDDGQLAAAVEALREHADGVHVDASHGTAILPREAAEVSAVLGLADDRMYAHKRALDPLAAGVVRFSGSPAANSPERAPSRAHR